MSRDANTEIALGRPNADGYDKFGMPLAWSAVTRDTFRIFEKSIAAIVAAIQAMKNAYPELHEAGVSGQEVSLWKDDLWNDFGETLVEVHGITKNYPFGVLKAAGDWLSRVERDSETVNQRVHSRDGQSLIVDDDDSLVALLSIRLNQGIEVLTSLRDVQSSSFRLNSELKRIADFRYSLSVASPIIEQNTNRMNGICLDEIAYGYGNRFPVCTNDFRVVEGSEPSICPRVVQSKQPLPEWLPTILEIIEDHGIDIPTGHTIHWVGWQDTPQTSCNCAVGANDDPAPEVLAGGVSSRRSGKTKEQERSNAKSKREQKREC